MLLQEGFHFRAGIILLWTLFYLCACSGGVGKPQRKKMPELNSLNANFDILYNTQPEKAFNIPVHTGYIDLLMNGKTTTFCAVNLPDDKFDSLAMSLAHSYKPMARALLTQWAQQEGTGIIVDLRHTAHQESIRAEFNINNDAFSIPVIFLYDERSAGRANTFIDILQSIPAVQCRQTGGGRSGKAGAYQDCFGGY